MRICRAEDGIHFDVQESLTDIQRAGNLMQFLHEITAVPLSSIVAYLSDGRLLQDSGVPESSLSSQESIFVFNKQFLDLEIEDVVAELHITPTSTSQPCDDSLSTSLNTGLLLWMTQLIDTLKNQLEALRIASSNLDLNLLTISDTYESFAESAQLELRAQDELLRNIDIDLEVISRVKIHPEFLSPAARRSQENGERSRTLGDYVSNSKMKQVADNCATLHADLQHRFNVVHDSFQAIMSGSAKIRQANRTISSLTESEGCLQRTRVSLERLTSGVPEDEAEVYREVIQRETQEICRLKNFVTEHCIHALRDISFFNADLLDLPRTLSILQADFRARSSFAHIQRLHSMLSAYGATLIEVVRRQEFNASFHQRANRIAEMLAKLTAAEKKRRQIYRSDVQVFMPFEVRTMEQPVPSVEMSMASVPGLQLSLRRSDIENLFDEVDQIGQSFQALTEAGGRDRNPMQEVKQLWFNLISRMDSLEITFDRAAERALLSSSRIIKRSAVFEHPSYIEATQRLEELQNNQSDMQAQFDDHRKSLEDEIDRLRSQCEDLNEALVHSRDKAEHLDVECKNFHAETEHLHQLRQGSELRIIQLTRDSEALRKSLDEAIREDQSKTREINTLKFELEQTRSEYQEVKNIEKHNAARVTTLLNDQQVTLRNLEEARSRGENLEEQIRAALAEGNEARRALEECEEKERLLRAQAGEHDRRLRDQIAEADGDRAVWEHQFSALRTELESTRSALDAANADLSGQREEHERTLHELREARRRTNALQADFDHARSAFSEHETRHEKDLRYIAELLQVAINYRQALSKAVSIAQSASLYPTRQQSGPGLADSVISMPLPPSSGNASTRPLFINSNSADDIPSIDPSEPELALDTLRELDLDACLESLSKPVSALRKWQKQCKDYRERAKGKITFRNFSKGDLALFLPIKNSAQKPWAAFNMAFPHYFLQATGPIAEQLKTREWIVARINSITEKVANSQEPGSNPFNLSDGIKYYMCQVEDWTQPSAKRGNSMPVNAGGSSVKPSTTIIGSNTLRNPQGMEKFAATTALNNETDSSGQVNESPPGDINEAGNKGKEDAGGTSTDMQVVSRTKTENEAIFEGMNENHSPIGGVRKRERAVSPSSSGSASTPAIVNSVLSPSLLPLPPSPGVNSSSNSGTGQSQAPIDFNVLDPPPSSHLFPSRGRVRSVSTGSTKNGHSHGLGSPGRSSLSKLLALATPSSGTGTADERVASTSISPSPSRTPSPNANPKAKRDALRDKKEIRKLDSQLPGSGGAILPTSSTMDSIGHSVEQSLISTASSTTVKASILVPVVDQQTLPLTVEEDEQAQQASNTTPILPIPSISLPHRRSISSTSPSSPSSKSPKSLKSPRPLQPVLTTSSPPEADASGSVLGSVLRSHNSRTSSSSTYTGAASGRTKVARPSPLGSGKVGDISIGTASPKALATIALTTDVSIPMPVEMHSGAGTGLSSSSKGIPHVHDTSGPSRIHTPSPAGSLSEGILNALHTQSQERKRTTSIGTGERPNPFRSFATSLGLPFGGSKASNPRERQLSTSSLTQRQVQLASNATSTDGNETISGVGEEGQIVGSDSLTRRESVRNKGASNLLRKLDQGA